MSVERGKTLRGVGGFGVAVGGAEFLGIRLRKVRLGDMRLGGSLLDRLENFTGLEWLVAVHYQIVEVIG